MHIIYGAMLPWTSYRGLATVDRGPVTFIIKNVLYVLNFLI